MVTNFRLVMSDDKICKIILSDFIVCQSLLTNKFGGLLRYRSFANVAEMML
jgi:hypothetical protein